MANPILANGVASPQSIYDEYAVEATNQTRAEGYHPVGTRGFLPDGRVFYYASNGTAALTTGSLVGEIPATIGLNRIATHDKIILTDSFGNFSVGAQRGIVLQESDVDTNDIIQDEYKDGYLSVQDVTGQGQVRKIARHSGFDASGTATTGTFDLFDPIKVALAATSQITLCRNEYDRVIASTTVEELMPFGVAPIDVTASDALATDVTTAETATTTYFFWAQSWGRCAVQETGTAVVAGASFTSGTTAKQVTASVAASLLMQNIGVCVQSVGSASDFIQVELRIKP